MVHQDHSPIDCAVVPMEGTSPNRFRKSLRSRDQYDSWSWEGGSVLDRFGGERV